MVIVLVALASVIFVSSPIIVLAILLFPYAVVVKKRMAMLSQIEKAAAQKGYKMFALHRAVPFSKNRSTSFDFLIENKDSAVAIKLWSAVKCENTLVINSDRTAIEISASPEPIKARRKNALVTVKRSYKIPVPAVKFPVRRGQTVEKILLYYPKYSMTLLDYGKERRELEDGDRIFGMTVCSPESLIDSL